ncbi:MAG: hypothetical protein K2O94_03985 [Clostridiales bacterium]|nr:hypothetical protein [Clostridiales bacterium]
MEEQITHIIESAQAGVIAVINNGELRRIGWEDLQNIANGNDTTAINNARTDAAEILKRKQEADDLRDTCKREAEELDAVAAGDMLICPECGDRHHRDDYTESKIEDNESVYTCPSCGASVDDLDDLDALSLSDYLAAALEIEYTADSSGEFKACRVWVGLGGPNICIDTARRAVCLYWWGNSAEYSIDCADEVDEIAAEWWEALRA